MMEEVLNNKWLKIGLVVISGLLLAGGLVFAGYWYGINSNLKTQKSKLQLKSQNLTPTLMPVVTSLPAFSLEPTLLPDETAGWKSYATGVLLLNYPLTWIVRETVPGFSVFLPDASIPPQSAPIALDTRLDKVYNQFVLAQKESITDPKTENITVAGNPATRISGKLGPGFGEGVFVISVVVNYQDKAIVFEYSEYSGEPGGIYQSTFDQILSTFKFLD